MPNQKQNASPMKKEIKMILMSVAVLTIMVTVSMLLPRETTQEEPESTLAPMAQVGAISDQTVAEGCEMVQTLTYTKCNHEVVRRVTVPTELYGKTLADVENLYPQWQITSFGALQIEMQQKPDMFCPDHKVLMINDAGTLCIYENKYGDALAMVDELSTDVSILPTSIKDELRMGKGFDTLEALEAWLESVES